MNSMSLAYDPEMKSCLQRLIEQEGSPTFEKTVGTLRSGRPMMQGGRGHNPAMEVSCGRY